MDYVATQEFARLFSEREETSSSDRDDLDAGESQKWD